MNAREKAEKIVDAHTSFGSADRDGLIRAFTSALEVPEDVTACFSIVAKHAYMKGRNTREDEVIDAAIETVQEFFADRTPQPEEKGEKDAD